MLIGLLACSAPAGAEWLTDFDQAKKEAAAKKLPILVDFTGSDWCGWCIKLDVADFPSRKKLPAATSAQNEQLAQTYGIEGYPTVLLLDAAGEVIARTGYQSGGGRPGAHAFAWTR
ncbi:MAG: thioredoxin family protein [Lentisphaerae bacterium]|nr:thioredoxin family protein [Lentisphaerota bacterium]